MTDRSLYDDDILLWSEQQAAALRRLGEARRYLPNELDIDNVAEEIESVGRSELAAVESQIELIFAHLIKLLLKADAEAVRHWQVEILGFHHQLRRRYAPSMRQRIDLDDIWGLAREQALLAYEGTLQEHVAAGLPLECPFDLADFLAERIESTALVERLRRAARPSAE